MDTKTTTPLGILAVLLTVRSNQKAVVRIQKIKLTDCTHPDGRCVISN